MGFFQQYKAFLVSIGSKFSGNFGVQGSGLATQMIGLAALLIGLFVFYIFFRMISRSMGCLIALIVILGVAGYVLTSVSGSTPGNSRVGGAAREMNMAVGQARGEVNSLKRELNQSINTIGKQFKDMEKLLR